LLLTRFIAKLKKWTGFAEHSMENLQIFICCLAPTFCYSRHP
jgi:hypothetical protein